MMRRRSLQLAVFAAVAVWSIHISTAQARAESVGVVETASHEPGLFGSSVMVVGGAIAVFVAFAVIIATLLMPNRKVSLLAPVGSGGSRATHSTIADLSKRAAAAAERTLDRGDRRRSIDALLEQAGLAIRAGELAVIVAVASGVAFLLGALLGGPVIGLVFAGLALLAARTVILAKRSRRRKAFGEQLDDTLQLLSGSLRAGYGLMQAIEAAGHELESPAVDEFRRLSTEVRLGRDIVDSLEAMAVRVANDDFGWVAQAIRIHREVGGDLTEVLDRVSETIRGRNHLRRQVRALSAEGKLSAMVLFGLPFAMAALLSIINPSYLGELFRSTVGYVFLAVGGVLLTVGGLWLRKLIRPTF